MDKLLAKDIAGMIETMSETIIENEVPFCELDSVAGDGDFGMSIAKGFRKLTEEWNDIDKEDIGAMLKSCALVIMEHCGGASGPIWGSAFNGAAKASRGKEEVDLAGFAEMITAAAASIGKKGGAKEGDKTLLDALIPTARTLEEQAAAGVAIPEALKAGAQAAVAGAEKTKEMVASRGRATYVGERSKGHPDAGAAALGVIFTAVADRFQ